MCSRSFSQCGCVRVRAAGSRPFGDAEGVRSVASIGKYISGQCRWLGRSQFKRSVDGGSDVLRKAPGKVRKCLAWTSRSKRVQRTGRFEFGSWLEGDPRCEGNKGTFPNMTMTQILYLTPLIAEKNKRRPHTLATLACLLTQPSPVFPQS